MSLKSSFLSLDYIFFCSSGAILYAEQPKKGFLYENFDSGDQIR